MGIHQLDYADKEYWDECLRDQQSLWIPVTLKRCISIVRDTDYPDNPPKLGYQIIQFSADIREASLQEVYQSGGVLVVGDNIYWGQVQLRGPSDINSKRDDPAAIADILIIHNTAWTVVGLPLVGRLRENVIGCQAFIRRRRGGMLDETDEAYDDAQAKV